MRLVIMSNKALIVSALISILTVGCKNGCNKSSNEKAGDCAKSVSMEEIERNPIAAKSLDSIPLPNLKDTARLDETGKDSLKFAVRFQTAANKMAKAEMSKNYALLASFAPENIIKRMGGREAYINRMQKLDENRPAYDKVIAGPIKTVAPAVDDEGFSSAWYCLIPVRSYRKVDGKDVVDLSWLGGQADISGKGIYFLNVTNLSKEQIMQVMPDLRFVLE